MKIAYLALLMLIPGIARADECEPTLLASTLHQIETYDGISIEQLPSEDRYSRAMREIGNWDINLLPAKIFEPEPKDWIEEEEWFGPKNLNLRTLIPRGYRPLHFEPLALYHFGHEDSWKIGLYGFESRTNLNYQERLITGLDNERAIGGAVLISYKW